MAQDFFPYHPRRFRVLLGLTGLASAALTVWAVLGFVRGGGLVEMVRAGLSAGLFAAMVTVVVRLRPRAGWGVKVGPTAVLVSRPIQGQIEVPWNAVREVRRVGSKRNTLALFLGDDARVLLPSHLFPSPQHFEAVVNAIEERMPRQPYDA